ncbi:uncharacterized protein BDW70DRAFT_148703 [Aspergillus foveolatus]|uniref:uncharacterized protein n=1 Tax=Aspergillus foveolatus TaxID=210207 RepID=UPI003CCD496F
MPHKTFTKSPFPDWEYGQGVPDGVSRFNVRTEIDPYASTRETVSIYRLLIPAITPRPIGFVSTVSASLAKDGKVVKNLAPFSYFQLNMIEAVNATSLDAPYCISEWEISDLTKAPSSTVRSARVRESVFSIEGRVIDIKQFAAHQEGMSGSGVVLIKATRFWVKKGVANEDLSNIELENLRHVTQLGGISYGRITSIFESPRTRWAEEVKKSSVLKELEERHRDGGSGFID